jgi:hypothetical protein
VKFYRVAVKGERPFFMEVTSESKTVVQGYEVNKEGSRIEPVGYSLRMRILPKYAGTFTEYRENFAYGGLEPGAMRTK